MSRPLAMLSLLVCACSPTDPDRCLPDDGQPRSPQSIGAVVELIDDLPHPVTADCIVEALERPLQIEATDSFFSVQPARGARSPRIFLFSGPVTLAVVPEGEGHELLELAETTSHARSVKGELALPVLEPLDPAAPYTRVAHEDGSGTECGFCHIDEVVHDDRLGSFDSIAMRPELASLVGIGTLEHLARTCDPLAEPDRCALLSAIFDHGPVEHREFPLDYPTVFDD